MCQVLNQRRNSHMNSPFDELPLYKLITGGDVSKVAREQTTCGAVVVIHLATRGRRASLPRNLSSYTGEVKNAYGGSMFGAYLHHEDHASLADFVLFIFLKKVILIPFASRRVTDCLIRFDLPKLDRPLLIGNKMQLVITS